MSDQVPARFAGVVLPDSGGLENNAAPHTQGAVGAWAPRIAENLNPNVAAADLATAQGQPAPETPSPAPQEPPRRTPENSVAPAPASQVVSAPPAPTSGPPAAS